MNEIVLPECRPSEIELVVITNNEVLRIAVELVEALVVVGFGLYFLLPSAPWQAGLLIVLLAFRLWQRLSRFRWSLLRLSAGRNSLRVSRQGRTVRDIPFEEIGTVQVGVKGELFWLRVLLRSGEVALEIPTTHRIVRRLHAIRSIVRQVRPQLSEDVAILRATSPDDNFEALLLASAFHAERPTIRHGVTYRYRSRAEFTKHLETLMPGVASSLYLAVVISSLTRILLHGMSSYAYLGLIVFLFFLREIIPLRSLIRSSNDTFYFEPDGTLVVTRKTRIRRFQKPSPALGWRGTLRIVDAPVLRYGAWPMAYYLDPRFIEEKR